MGPLALSYEGVRAQFNLFAGLSPATHFTACLQSVTAGVERQKCMPPETDDRGLFRNRQHGAKSILRPRPFIDDRTALAPFRDCLWGDSLTLGERSQALLPMRYRSTDYLCGSGARQRTRPIAHPARPAATMRYQKLGSYI